MQVDLGGASVRSKRVIGFKALDDTQLVFDVPRGVNRFLALKAIEKVHKGGDEAMVMFGLTRAESEFVAEVIATLEEHREAKT